MRETTDLRQDGINDVEEFDSKITDEIYDRIEESEFDKDLTEYNVFVGQVRTVQSSLDSLESDGIEDSLEAIKKDIDRASGQLKNIVKVTRAGARPVKAVEYAQYASKHLRSAIEHIGNLSDYITGESDLSSKSLTDDTTAIKRSASEAIHNIEHLREVLDSVIEEKQRI